jgi:hypothetical protein
MAKNDRESTGPATPSMTARTAKVSVDSRLTKVAGFVQALNGAPSMLHSNVEPGVSVTKVNVTTGMSTVEPSAGPEVIVATGGGWMDQL